MHEQKNSPEAVRRAGHALLAVSSKYLTSGAKNPASGDKNANLPRRGHTIKGKTLTVCRGQNKIKPGKVRTFGYIGGE
jgi:hypothetical protein